MKKTKQITIKENKGKFLILKSKAKQEFENLALLKKVLSKEKARILNIIKLKNPNSIYELAKTLDRPFKAVHDDVKILEKFGLLKITKKKEKNRTCHKPEIATDEVIIKFRI